MAEFAPHLQQRNAKLIEIMQEKFRSHVRDLLEGYEPPTRLSPQVRGQILDLLFESRAKADYPANAEFLAQLVCIGLGSMLANREVSLQELRGDPTDLVYDLVLLVQYFNRGSEPVPEALLPDGRALRLRASHADRYAPFHVMAQQNSDSCHWVETSSVALSPGRKSLLESLFDLRCLLDRHAPRWRDQDVLCGSKVRLLDALTSLEQLEQAPTERLRAKRASFARLSDASKEAFCRLQCRWREYLWRPGGPIAEARFRAYLAD
ncbi:MAG: hypothetical protein ACYCOU_08520 [Sulfobacillus sp.]